MLPTKEISRPDKMGVIGTVGIPARYGGFETLAEQLARSISPADLQLAFYCQASAYTKEESKSDYMGHERIFIPLRANGISSLLYDFISAIHAALIARASAILFLGVSGAFAIPILRLISPSLRIITNVDGVESRRQKFSYPAKLLLRCLEWIAIRGSHQVIADNEKLADILSHQFPDIRPVIIAYGGDHTLVAPRDDFANEIPGGFFLSIARIEPENNCHLILEAFSRARTSIVFVGNWTASRYGRALMHEYEAHPNIFLLPPVYDLSQLRSLRTRAIGYVHGHSVGGSNPSLIEAIFHTDLIYAFDCPFNRATLSNAGCYFNASGDLNTLLHSSHSRISAHTLATLRSRYEWRNVAAAYLSVSKLKR